MSEPGSRPPPMSLFAADLSAGRADVDFGDVAVGADGGQEALTFADVAGEDGGGQALGHTVQFRDGVVEVIDRDDVQDRREGLILYGLVLVLGAHNGGYHEVAAFEVALHLCAASAAQQFSAFLLHGFQGSFHGLHGIFVDERSAQGRSVVKVAEADAFVGLEKAGFDHIDNGLLHEVDVRSSPGNGAKDRLLPLPSNFVEMYPSESTNGSLAMSLDQGTECCARRQRGALRPSQRPHSCRRI